VGFGEGDVYIERECYFERRYMTEIHDHLDEAALVDLFTLRCACVVLVLSCLSAQVSGERVDTGFAINSKVRAS
jgi:hypothetical protein